MPCGCGRSKGDALAASAALKERQQTRKERIEARAAARQGRPAVWSGKTQQPEPEST